MSDRDDESGDEFFISRTGGVIIEDDIDQDATIAYAEISPSAKRIRVDTVDLTESDEEEKAPNSSDQQLTPNPRWPVYASSKLSRDDATRILFNTDTHIDNLRVCSSVPPGPFERGFSAFVIDLDLRVQTKPTCRPTHLASTRSPASINGSTERRVQHMSVSCRLKLIKLCLVSCAS